MKVKIKKLNENAKIPYKTHDEDFCYDVVATSCEEIAPNVWKYGLGLAFEVKRDYEPLLQQNSNQATFPTYTSADLSKSPINLSIDLRPRSSIWKTGMVLSNSTGTLDEFYRGEVSAVFYHIMTNMPKYEIGDRIAQIKIGLTLPIQFEEADTLNTTERGEGGYGSTGK